MNTIDTTPPTILAYSVPAGKRHTATLVFHCATCARWHTHGFPDGHRVAHCFTAGTYPNGYILVDTGPLTDEIVRAAPTRKGLPLQFQTKQYQAREKALLHGW